MASNPLTSVDGRDLKGLKNLTILYLGSCTLNAIPANFLYFVPNLKEIDLSNNNISEVPSTLFSPTNFLSTCDLSRNSLRIISDQFVDNLRMLRSLYFADNKLQGIPHYLLASASNLKIFDSSGNDIRKLSADTFETNTKLLTVGLDHNNLTTLPESLFNSNSNLGSIFLKANRLQFLPGRLFSRTKMLSASHLSYNELKEIPEQLFESLHHLTYLNLKSNKLVRICKTCFRELHQLKTLNLAKNNLSFLPDYLFARTVLLETLDLANNNIKELPDGLFHSVNKTHSLSELYLQGNQLMHLSAKIFRGLEKLRTLCLFNNRIETIEDGVFTSNVMRQVFLFDNKLHEVSINSFQSVAIADIHLYGNNVTHFSRISKQLLAPHTKLYINCEYLHEVQRLHVQIICIHPMFVPRIQINNINIASLMKKEGFQCLPVHRSIKFPPAFVCSPCPRGTYANGSNKCLKCPKGGFYQDRIGIKTSTESEIGCKKCQNGTFVKEDGSGAIANCTVCPEGTNKAAHAAFRACFCSDGFARVGRFGPCYKCSHEGLNCTAGQDYQSLYAGYYWNWTFPDASITEYVKFVANLETLSMHYDNHTFYRLQIPKVYKCPNPSSCANDMEHGSVIGKCATGYIGWMCHKCKGGFYAVMSNCFRCPNMSYMLVKMFLFACLCAVVFYFMCWQLRGERGSHKASRGFTSIFVSRVKITLGFYQVVGEFWGSLHELQWTGNLQVVDDFINFVEMNVMKIFIRLSCCYQNFVVNPQTEFIVAMCVLFILTAGPFLISSTYKLFRLIKVLLKADNNDSNIQLTSQKVKANLLTFVIAALFVLYPQVCRTIFQLYPLACKTFCLDMNNKHCIKVLRSDFEVSCEQLTIYQVAAYIATILYVFAFPLSLLYLLRKHCSKKGEQKSSHSKQITGFDKTISFGILFLHDNFKTKYYYWDVLELSRKFAQTVSGTLFGWENNISMLFTIGISVLFLVLHVKHMPMEDSTDQKLQMLSLCVILINMVVFALDVSLSPYAWVLVLLNISVIVIIVAEAVVGIILQVKHVLKRRKKLE